MSTSFFTIRIVTVALLTWLLCACANTDDAPPLVPTSIPTFTPELAPRPAPHVEVYADGLIAPIGMTLLADGTLVVAEDGTGLRDDSAGVSLITPEGQVGRFLSGLPSTRDSGDLAGAPLVGLSPDGATLYIGNFGVGHLWTYELSQEEQTSGIRLPETALTTDQLGTAMDRLNNVLVVNPFDIDFDPDGVPVVTDSTGNGVAKQNPDGTTRFIQRFDQLPNPIQKSDPIEAVPTGIQRIGDEYYVTLTGGCPYPEGGGRLVAIDEERNQRTVVDGLNMPIDVALGPDGTIWLLEFARFTPDADCFSGTGYQVETGRLSRLLPDGSLETVLDGLNYPGAILPGPDRSLFVSEVFPGRVLRVILQGEGSEGRTSTSSATASEGDVDSRDVGDGDVVGRDVGGGESERLVIDDVDGALRAAIGAHGFEANPGIDLREADTPQAQLGQLLFFDPILSGDLNISCATCHHPTFAMADGRTLPIGTGGTGLGPGRRFLETVTLADEAGSVRRLAGETDEQTDVTTVNNPFAGQFVPRNSPTILNSALFPRQFWDGRVEAYALDGSGDGPSPTVKTLERTVNDLNMDDPLAAQALFPVASLHEMAGATLGGKAAQSIRTVLLDRLRANSEYVDLFRETFGTGRESPEDAVTLSRLVEALAAFERRFIFTDAPWDHYLDGDLTALTHQQKRGALLFTGALDPAINCIACHSGNLFTDFNFHNILVPQLGPGRGHGYTGREDWGRAGVTFDARDRYAFRTPSLRNVALTAPYFHDGAYARLEDAIRHHADVQAAALTYDPSAAGVPPDLYSSLQPVDLERQWRTVAPILQDSLPLSDEDVADLAAFLGSLTDPAAVDLSAFLPDQLPSGLALDPLPKQSDTDLATAAPIPTTQPPTAPLPDALLTTEFHFSDVAAQVGIDFVHGAFKDAIYDDAVAAMGGGLCWLDFDNDGWLDLYLVNSFAEEETAHWLDQGGLPHNALFRNEGGVFTDVGTGSGANVSVRGNGCVAADFNLDGWTDLYVTTYGPNILLWNNGDSTFSHGAGAAGIDAPEWNAGAAAGDLNGDGWPDLFVTSYIDFDNKIPKPSGAFPQDYYGLPDRLYLNQGPKERVGTEGVMPVTFREVTLPAGLVREERGLGAILSDLDLDGDLDLYIANDGHPNRLYANVPWPDGIEADPEGLGFRFVDLTDTANVGDSGSGMGISSGDYDGDGRFDLLVTNWERELNALYRNETNEQDAPTFQYSTFRIGVSGLGNGLTGWGNRLADFDHDGDADLLIVNGRVPVTNLETDPELARYYRNRSQNPGGGDARPGQFLEWTGQVGLKEVGPLLGRGSAVADYDNDGDLDVAINQIAGHAILLQNDLSEADAAPHWLQVSLDGSLLGSRVVARLPDGRELIREVQAGSSYLSTEDPRLHFGLGSMSTADLAVFWPDGTQTFVADVEANQHLTVAADTEGPAATR